MRLAIIIYLVIIKSDYISIIIFYGAIGIIFAVVFQCFLIQAIPSMISLFFSSEGDEFNSGLVSIISALYKVRLKAIETMSEDGTFDVLPKKEVIALKKEWEKLEKNLGGIKDMKRIPDAIFVVDPKKERICIKEAQALGITLIGIADTNCDPDELDYVIPGNDDAIRAVKLIVSKMADAVIEAKQGAEEEVTAEEASDETVEE
jgi:hypothetical protein